MNMTKSKTRRNGSHLDESLEALKVRAKNCNQNSINSIANLLFGKNRKLGLFIEASRKICKALQTNN